MSDITSLENKLLKYTQKTKKIFLPYIWESWGVEPSTLTKAIVSLWDKFDNPKLADKLLCVSYDGETPNVHEICDTKYVRGNNIVDKKLLKYSYNNNKEDQHVSVFTHDSNWIKNYEQTGSVSCMNTNVGVPSIILELDRDSLDIAIRDAVRIGEEFPYPDYIKFWYSGNKSIHIEIDGSLFGNIIGSQHSICGSGKLAYNLAHKIVGDVRHSNGLVDPYYEDRSDVLKEYYKAYGRIPDKNDMGYIRQKLENIDPNLFRINSLVRQPFSIHEKGKRMKTLQRLDNLRAGKIRTAQIPHDRTGFVNKGLPHLLHWVYECYKPKEKFKQLTQIDVDSDEVLKLFSKIFDYFDPDEANSQGWVGGLFSPFYKDTNPSVSVNVNTGYYKDFGEPTHNFNFETLKQQLNDNK